METQHISQIINHSPWLQNLEKWNLPEAPEPVKKPIPGKEKEPAPGKDLPEREKENWPSVGDPYEYQAPKGNHSDNIGEWRQDQPVVFQA